MNASTLHAMTIFEGILCKHLRTSHARKCVWTHGLYHYSSWTIAYGSESCRKDSGAPS